MISSNKASRPLSCKIVEINTEFEFERHKKVVFPLSFNLDTALTIAGCYKNYYYFSATTLEARTDEGHDSKGVKNLIFCDTEAVCFS